MQAAISRGFTLYKLTARETGAFFGGGGRGDGCVQAGFGARRRQLINGLNGWWIFNDNKTDCFRKAQSVSLVLLSNRICY